MGGEEVCEGAAVDVGEVEEFDGVDASVAGFAAVDVLLVATEELACLDLGESCGDAGVAEALAEDGVAGVVDARHACSVYAVSVYTKIVYLAGCRASRQCVPRVHRRAGRGGAA